MDGLEACILFGVSCIAILVGWALYLGIDGVIFGAGASAITACIGWKAKAYKDKRKSKGK